MAPKTRPKITVVSVRLSAQMIERIDELAPQIAAEKWEKSTTRGDVIRYLIKVGIERLCEAEQKKEKDQ